MPLFVIKGRPIEFGLASLLNNKTVYRRVCDEIRRNGGKITHSRRRCFDNQVVQLDDREVLSVVSVGNEMITSAHQARGPDSFHYSYVERCVMSGYVLDPRPFRVQRDSVFTCDASILRVVLADWTWKRLLAQKQLSSTTDVSNRKQLPDQTVPKHSVEATVTSIAEYNKHDAARQRPPAVTTVNCSSQSNLSGNGSFSVASQHGRRQKRFSELQLEFLSGSRAVTSSSLRRPVPSKREGLLRSRVKKRPGSLNLVRSSALDRNSDRTEFCHSGDLQTSTRTGSTVTTQCLDRSTQSALRVCSSSLECGRSGGFAAVSYHGSYNHDKNVLPASGNDNNNMLPVNGYRDKMILPANGVHDNKISVVNGNHDNKKVNADRSIIRPFDSCLSTNSSTISSDSFKNGISRLDDFSSCGETSSGSVDRGTIDDQDDILESSLLNSPRLGCSQRPHSSALDGMKHQHTSAISSQAHAQSNLMNVYAKDTCVDSVASTSNSSISAPVIENSLIPCDSHVAVNRSHSNWFSSDICESIAPVSPISCELPQLPSAALSESHSAIPMTRTGRQSIPESSPKLTDQHIIILLNSIVCCHEEGCLSPAAPITNQRFWCSLHPLLPNTLQQYSAEFLHVHFVDEILPRLGSWQQYLDHCVVQRFIKLLPVPIADAARSQFSSKQEISAPENRSVTGASVLLQRVLSRFVAPPCFLN